MSRAAATGTVPSGRGVRVVAVEATRRRGYLAPPQAAHHLPERDTAASAVPGLDDARFQDIAASAKRDCPLSKALASVPEISLVATLEPG